MMGASLCKSIKKYKIAKKVSGFDRDLTTLNFASENKIVDIAYNTLDNLDHPDLIILCTPISAYTEITNQISKSINKKTIMTDIGSSKGNSYQKIIKKF